MQTLGTNFSEIISKIHTFYLAKMHLENVVCEMVVILSRPQCDKSRSLPQLLLRRFPRSIAHTGPIKYPARHLIVRHPKVSNLQE